MIRRLVLAAFLVLTLISVGAWIQSYLGGCQHEWSDSLTARGGRIVSSRGLLFLQTCDFEPETAAAIYKRPGQTLRLPEHYAVGGDGDDGRVTIPIGGVNVPFVRPASGTYLLLDQSTKGESAADGYWYASARQYALAYWLMTLILLLFPLKALVWSGFRARKPNKT